MTYSGPNGSPSVVAVEDNKLAFGTFMGVFTPSVLTILGAIMYLRFGWVVGNAGLSSTIMIVLLANLVTLATALSVSALATSQKVGVGGAYYLVSRSLGLAMGGAVGLPLYLSQAVSITLYSYALVEALQYIWPTLPLQLTAAGLVVVITLGAAKSTSFALKSQAFILIAVALSIASLLWGADWGAPISIAEGTYSDVSVNGFWDVFAVFFPAVTGILTGLSLSGDLRDPEKSLPIGTISAVLVGFIIYIFVPLALAHHDDVAALNSDPLVWLSVAAVPMLIFPGLISAILSSALGSVLAAPRTLQALSDDTILPAGLGRLSQGQPKIATWVSGCVALLAVLLGDLNAVATVVTLFFLTTYGMINVVSTIETVVGNPSYRPRMRVHWILSLAAAVACFSMMFLISPSAAVIAFFVEALIYVYLSRRSLRTTWGDMRAGMHLAIARWALLKQRDLAEHPRNWRPHILVFSSKVERDLNEIKLATGLSQDRGIITVATLKVGDFDQMRDTDIEAAANDRLLVEEGITAFCEVDVVPDLETGIITVAQANGIAGVQSNTVMLRWPRTESCFPPSALRVMRRLEQLGLSLLVVRLAGDEAEGFHRIDVWWSGREDNGDLMLLLAHLLTQNRKWRRAVVTIKTVVDSLDLVSEARESLELVCEETRIDAEVVVVVRREGEDIKKTIKRHSAEGTMVMLGLGIPEVGLEEKFGERMTELVEGLPNVILVRNSGPFKGQLIHTAADQGSNL
jgi:amino acid transporter